MRTQTTTINVYAFSELSDKAKERARDAWRQGIEFDSECITDDFKTAAQLLGVTVDDVYWSGFYSQGDGASFTGSYRYRKGWRAALRSEFGGELGAELEAIGERLQACQARVLYTGTISVHTQARYHHSGNMRASSAETFGSSYSDSVPDFESDTLDDLRGLADTFYAWLEREWDYQNSDEVVDESMTTNECEFTEEGAML